MTRVCIAVVYAVVIYALGLPVMRKLEKLEKEMREHETYDGK